MTKSNGTLAMHGTTRGRSLYGGRLSVSLMTIKKRPDVLLIPMLLFAVLVGLGCWGAMAGRQLYIEQAKQSASHEASATLSSIVQILQISYTPLLALREKIVADPSVPALLNDWTSATSRLLSSVNKASSLISLEVATFGIISAVDPITFLGPSLGLDLLSLYPYQLEKEMIWGGLGWEGPFFIHQGNWTMLASLPIFVASNYSSAKPDPSWGGPPTNGTCNIPQCKANGTKWWGAVYALFLLDPLLQEPTLINLKSHGWAAKLTRVMPQGYSTPDPVLFNIGGANDLLDPVSVMLDLGHGHNPEQSQLLLKLSLSPSSGSWAGGWWIGALVGVIFLGLGSSILLFLHLISSVQLSWLLYSMIPPSVVARMQSGQTFAALHDCCILFCDVVGFTSLTRNMDPRDVAILVDELTGIWEEEAARGGLLRIDVIGDSFMAGCGCLEETDPYDSAARTARVALAIIKSTRGLVTPDGTAVQVRVGIHSGPCVTAVVGSRCPKLSVFSDVVNVASRMESTGLPGMVHLSPVVATRLIERGGLFEAGLELVKRGLVKLKNRGDMETYWLYEAGSRAREKIVPLLEQVSPSVSFLDIQLDRADSVTSQHIALPIASSPDAAYLSPAGSLGGNLGGFEPRRVKSYASHTFWAQESRVPMLRRNPSSPESAAEKLSGPLQLNPTQPNPSRFNKEETQDF